MSIDAFFHRKYNRETYNCAHFVCDVWENLTGEQIAHKLGPLLLPPKERYVAPELRRHFRKLERPESPCVVLMQRRGSPPHVGIFVRGRVLHIHERGVEFQPTDVASRGFERTGFYK